MSLVSSSGSLVSSGGSLLERILASKRAEIEALKSTRSEWLDRAPATEPKRRTHETIDVVTALRRAPGAPLRLLAEIKKKSPSAGELSRALDAGARASAYARGGAATVSVLCDEPFFGGGWGDLAAARAEVDRLPRPVPLLAKEFVLDEIQIQRARAAGADAVLLIARIVSAPRLKELYDAARACGLEPLVEIVDEAELAAAVACSARLVGVNARDLDTLAMDAERTRRLLAEVPAGVVRVYLSGIKSEEDVRAVARGGADAALIGEALMREADPEPRLRALVAAGTG